RGSAPHALLDSVRRRPAPLHRPPLRGAPDQGRPAPARAPLPLERRARLPDARAAGADLEAARRAAGAFRAPFLSRSGPGRGTRLPARRAPWYIGDSMRPVNLVHPGQRPRISPLAEGLGLRLPVTRVRQ